MKSAKLLVSVFAILNFLAVPTWAIKGVVATDEEIARLKSDLKEGRIDVNKTRLKFIAENYGEPSNVTQTDKKVVYDYGDLKLEFEKKKRWRNWEYDTFKEAVYTDDVDDLRFDLESEELVGKNISYDKVVKDYGEPTESFPTEDDGGLSVYYYGDIKMVFENKITMSTWKGQNLGKVNDKPEEGELSATETKTTTPAPSVKDTKVSAPAKK